MKRDAGELTSLDQCQDTVDTMWHSSSDWYVETFQYLNGYIRPHYPVPAVINWGNLPPPDIVRLMTGGMWHRWK